MIHFQKRITRTLGSTIAVATLAVLSACVTGPTLGELLDKGARKMSKAEVVQGLSGKTVKGDTHGGALNIDNKYSPDGTYTGAQSVLMGQYKGATTRVAGTWAVDDSGKFCVEEKQLDWDKTASKCWVIYAHGDKIVLALGDERNAEVTGIFDPSNIK